MATVAITGASSGIGKAMAWEFARRGNNLVLLARRMDLLQQLQQEISTKLGVRVESYELDVAQPDSILPVLEQADKELGGLNSVIANAGITGVNKTGAGDFSKDTKVIQVNLIGGMATVDAAARLFRTKGEGTIVGISSVSAFKGIPGSAAYSASKAGFTNYLDAVRMELKKHKISVLTVHPGFVKTDIAPGMEKRPFVISPEKAAKDIVDGIQKGVANIIVPRVPWSVLGRVIPMLPDKVIEKAF